MRSSVSRCRASESCSRIIWAMWRARFSSSVNEVLLAVDHQFGGGGRRGRAQVGDKIRDRKIRFVAHGGDHRNLRKRRWLAPPLLR